MYSTAFASHRQAHRFFGFLLSLCFGAVAIMALVAPALVDHHMIVGVLLGSGIIAGIMLGSISWSRLAPGWLDAAFVGLVILVAALMLFSGAANSPFMGLFFVVTAYVATSSRRTSSWAIVTLIIALQIVLLGLNALVPSDIIRALFNSLAHLAIAASVHITRAQHLRTQSPTAPAERSTQIATAPLRDQLTGLYTSAAVARHVLDIQASGAGRFSMVVIEVADWQGVCEKYGQRSGDDVIRQLAVLLQNHSRSSDIPVRYDDHTFAIIFPGASAEIALRLGERLRAVIEQHRFWTPHSPTRLAISLSLAVSSYPEDGSSADELVQRAVKRMQVLHQAHETPTEAAG